MAAVCAFVPNTAWAVISHNGEEIPAGEDYVVMEESGACQGHVFSGHSEDDWIITSGQKIVISGGTHTITLEDLTIDDPGNSSSAIDIKDNAQVTLILKGENVLEAMGSLGKLGSHPGIWVEEGSSLTIKGTGSLVVRAHGDVGGQGAAGIGSGYDESAFGDITIEGGVIEAYGAAGGAGIGGGYKVGGGTQSGNITITGGFVQAFGGEESGSSGAGIGAGENADFDGTITISGGVVRAMGGNKEKSSIGGGGSIFGSTGNGTFTTGANGNAVIAAPWGIGDTSNVADWDCILLEPTRESTSEIQYVNYDQESDTVTFSGGTPQVYGDVVVDYNIVVNSPASLRIETEIDLDGDPTTANNAPSTLTIPSSHTLTNNNASTDPGLAGIALEPGSILVLEDGTKQCLGNGFMIVVSTADSKYGSGKVQLPISDDMVSVNPTTYVYDGAEKEPAVTVRFNKWGYKQTFKQGTDYTVNYMANVNVGTATATATSIESSDLLDRNGARSTGSAEFEITRADLVVYSVVQRYVQVGEDELLSKLPKEPFFGPKMPESVRKGTFGWYSDAACETPLTEEFVKDASEGANIPVYWKYEQTEDSNYESIVTGKTQLIMTDEEPPYVAVDGKAEGILKRATYGDPAYTPEITISLDGGNTWVEPPSEVTYQVESQIPAEQGDVVSVDPQTGEISFEGAGEATVLAKIEGYTDPNQSGASNNSYGPANVTIRVIVDPKEIHIDADSVAAKDRVYNGTRNVEVAAKLDADGTVGTDFADSQVYVTATGVAKSPAVGENIPVEVTYELVGDKADDYKLVQGPDTTVTISKAQAGDDTLQGKSGDLTISNGVAATYVFDLQKLVPDTQPVGDEGAALIPGRIRFENPKVEISDKRYFDEGSIRIDNMNQRLYLMVNDVESQDASELGTIRLDMISPNFEGMFGTITVKRANPVKHTITASAGTGGSITPEGAVQVIDGEDQEFGINPSSGYEIDTVTVDGNAVAADDASYKLNADGTATYTFEDVNADYTIAVTFKAVDDGGNPGGNPGGDGDGDTDPDNPGGNPGTDPDEPGTDPGTDPDNPGTDPGTDPDEPGTDPDNPGAGENPGTDPGADNPGTVDPGAGDKGDGDNADHGAGLPTTGDPALIAVIAAGAGTTLAAAGVAASRRRK